MTKQWRTWVFNLFLWSAIALVQSLQTYSSVLSEGYTPHIRQILALQFATWLPWAALSPFLFMLSERYPLEHFFSRRALLLYPFLGIACVCLQLSIHTLGMLIAPEEGSRHTSFWPLYLQMIRWMISSQLIVFAGIVGASHAINYYRRFKDREIHASQLEQRLVEARLLALRMQIQPHFLFNTLHSIASLVRERQNDTAVTMIARLSDLLRYTLDQADKQKVPLGQELEFIHQYLEIEQTRFSDRLTVEISATPEALQSQVPTLILQPIVENAVKHGLSNLTRPGTLQIDARRDGSELLMCVTNDGNGFHGGAGNNGGLGLRNVSQRMQQLYGSAQRMDIRDEENGRVSVSLTIPFERNGNV